MNTPIYDLNGEIVDPEDEEEYGDEDPYDGVFNAHLLEEDYLDAQEYEGSMSDYVDSDDQKNEEKIRKDVQKHLNIHFEDEEYGDQSQSSQSEYDEKNGESDLQESDYTSP